MPLIGMDALLRQMADAPDAIRREGMEIVRETTEACAEEIRRNYPEASQDSLRVARGAKTGVLRDRVKVSFPSSTVLVGVVESRAPHSHMYELGTAQRRTSRGWNRGRMPAKKTVANFAPKHRARMHRKLVAMVEKHGFEVTEE